MHYTTLRYTTLIYTTLHYTTCRCATLGHRQKRWPLQHTATIATTKKNTTFRSIIWILSAIRYSQQPSSPTGFLSWNFCRRLVRYYWKFQCIQRSWSLPMLCQNKSNFSWHKLVCDKRMWRIFGRTISRQIAVCFHVSVQFLERSVRRTDLDVPFDGRYQPWRAVPQVSS